jgi:hypothetical protein
MSMSAGMWVMMAVMMGVMMGGMAFVGIRSLWRRRHDADEDSPDGD